MSHLLDNLLHLVGGELLLVHPLVLANIQSVESLEVFKELSESLEEESELRELDEVVTVRVLSLGHRLHMVKTAVDGRDSIKQLIHCDHISHTLKQYQDLLNHSVATLQYIPW